MTFENLLSPINIGSLKIRNRVVMGAMGSGTAHDNATVSECECAYYAERAKGPGQRVAAAVVFIRLERRKTRAFSQQAARGDAVGQGGVATLQVGHDGADGAAVVGELVQEGMHAGAAFGLGLGLCTVAHGVQPGGREQFEHEGERQVFLYSIKAARAQEAREISSRGVGRVELRHRWDEAQHAKGGGHGV